MQTNLPRHNHGPVYVISKFQFPNDETNLRLLYQQWTSLPWIPAGSSPGLGTMRLHIKGTVKPIYCEPVSTLPIRYRNQDTRFPSRARPQSDPIRIAHEATHLPLAVFPEPGSIHPTIRVLNNVRILLCIDWRWTKNALAEDQFGRPVHPARPNATRWSLRGAIEREAHRFEPSQAPASLSSMLHHALLRAARKQLPAVYRPADRAHRSARSFELIDLIHNARTFDHGRLLAWCEATLDLLRSFHPPKSPSRNP